jgi:hypothetical protein
MANFSVQQKTNLKELALTLAGAIDEDVQFPVLNLAGIEQVIFDLKEIKSINSVGIREWLNWIKPIAEQCQLSMKNCPKVLVFQFNMVEGFLPKGAQVQSLYVPFFCEKCDKEENILFNLGKEFKLEAGTLKLDYDIASFNLCKDPACDLAMDVSEAKYFHFVKRMSA